MTVFADTSAVIKLFLDEPYSGEMRSLVGAEPGGIAACRIAWAEAFAGLAQRARLKTVDEGAANLARTELKRLWPGFSIVEVTQPLVQRAGDYAEAFALRAYDSMQLAAAQELAESLDQPLCFACFDQRLNRAAQVLGMTVPFIDAR
jgi:predicted nucleic acid-binding protein